MNPPAPLSAHFLFTRCARTSPVRHFPQWAGAAAACLGLLIVAGWHAHWGKVLQILPGSAPMQYNTALCFLLCAIGLLILTTPRARVASLPGCLAGLIGSLTLLEYLTAEDFRIDQFFLVPYFEAASAYPGRMSPLAAGCFVLVALVLVLMGSKPRWAHWLTTSALLACIVAVIAAVAALGYAFGIGAAYGWGAYSRMAVSTALGFLSLGSGLLVLAVRTGKAGARNFLHWLPVTGSVTLMLMIAFVSAMNRADLRKATFWRRHTFEVILGAQSFEQNLVEIQRGLRGYALSGDRTALASHEAGVRLEPRLFDGLVELTSDNPGQQERLGRLASAMRRVLAYDRRALATYNRGGYAAFLKLDALGESRPLMGDARDALKAFSQEEERLLDGRDASEQMDSSDASRLLVFGSVVAVALLIIANAMTAREMSRRRRSEVERERLIGELRQALAEVKTLSGLIPICGWCKSVRSDKGFWETVEQYVCSHTAATFTHGICPVCADKMKAEIAAMQLSELG